MKYSTIEPSLDLNDPERGFVFATNGDGVLLSVVDWQNRYVSFAFETVFYFSYRLADGYQNLPEGEAIEVVRSRCCRPHDTHPGRGWRRRQTD